MLAHEVLADGTDLGLYGVSLSLCQRGEITNRMLHGPDKCDLVVSSENLPSPVRLFEAHPSGLPISANFHVHQIFTAAAASAKD
jgi:hypothetical protein